MSALKPPPRRDYAVFLSMKALGTLTNGKGNEFAITGTALPVLLRAEPGKLNFGECQQGQKRELAACLYNDSQLREVKFKFCKVGNFIVTPACGRLAAKSSKKVLVSFIPHQIGKSRFVLFVIAAVIHFLIANQQQQQQNN
jgi:hypothetical protein